MSRITTSYPDDLGFALMVDYFKVPPSQLAEEDAGLMLRTWNLIQEVNRIRSQNNKPKGRGAR